MFARYFKKIPKAETESFDISSSAIATKEGGVKPSVKNDKNTLWLKYKEGFINAVRYNIKINKLL